MAFEAQNELERSLLKAVRDPAHRPQFIRDFLESNILLIQQGPRPDQAGPKRLEAGDQLRIAPMEFQGQQVLPIFSSLPRLQMVIRQEVGVLELNARAFLEITRGAEVFLNPGSDYGKIFTKEEIADLLGGSLGQPTTQTVERSTQVLLGHPSRYPKELVESLARFFETTAVIKRAWVAHIVNAEANAKGHTMIAVEIDGGDLDQIMKDVGIIVQSVTIPDPPVDFIRITGDGGLDDYFLKQSEPFYVAK